MLFKSKPKHTKNNDILVIPDTHVEPGQNNERARWLGNLIADRQPSCIVHIGDLAELGSMSFHDPIKSTAYDMDVRSVKDFMELLKQHASNAWTDANTYFLEGNHEARIRRRIAEQPELAGTIKLEDFGVYEDFDQVIEWSGGPGVLELNGVLFAHFIQGRTGRALGGVNHARTLLLNCMQSCVVGHSHALSYACQPLPRGDHAHGIVCGCFYDHFQEYAGQFSDKFWRGVVYLHDVRKGELEPEFISLKRLRDTWRS